MFLKKPSPSALEDVYLKISGQCCYSATSLLQELHQFKHRKNKMAAVTACSNVTGIQTPYHEIAKLSMNMAGYVLLILPVQLLMLA